MYLITIEFLQENGALITEAGRYYEEQTKALAARYPDVCAGVEGQAHMTALRFFTVEDAVAFCRFLNDACIDISAQAYKPNCPPVALTKLPLITTPAMVDLLLSHFEDALQSLAKKEGA